MCGIVGLQCHSLPQDPGFIQRRLAQVLPLLRARGPDHQRHYIDRRTGLGHTRLSIQDTRAVAHQPMLDASGRYVIVYNGELYNTPTLRAALMAKGAIFRTHSDTEVVLNAYISEGEACLERFNGFFAFGIYDTQTENLFLARDRFGIKPLYYASFGHKDFAFASNLGVIQQLLPASWLNLEGLYTYLQLYFVPYPDTLLAGVYKLPPGCHLRIEGGSVRLFRYYQTPYHTSVQSPSSGKRAVFQRHFMDLLDASVRARLLADVPLGCFLSGGIDSSLIAAVASRHVPNLKTFSMGYSDAAGFDETSYATRVARHLGTDHYAFRMDTAALASAIEAVITGLDEPLADSSAIPSYLLCAQVSQHVKVVLSGDGADEIFSGYSRHKAHYAALYYTPLNRLLRYTAPLWRRLPEPRSIHGKRRWHQLLKYLNGIELGLKARYWLWSAHAFHNDTLEMLAPSVQKRLKQKDCAKVERHFTDYLNTHDPLNGILYADLHLLLANDMLAKVDRMSMAHGLEVRVPFLDHTMVEYAFGLAAKHKWTAFQRKRLLRECCAGVLPPVIQRRGKHGFEVPLTQLLQSTHHAALNKYVFDRARLDQQGLFAWPPIQALQNAFKAAPHRDLATRLWALYVFQKWMDAHAVKVPEQVPSSEKTLTAS